MDIGELILLLWKSVKQLSKNICGETYLFVVCKVTAVVKDLFLGNAVNYVFSLTLEQTILVEDN